MKTAFVLLFFVASTSFASGSRVGNGGMGVACSGRPVELLDFYEAREEYGLVPTWRIGVRTLQEELDHYVAMLSSILPVDHPFVRTLGDDLIYLSVSIELVDEPLVSTLDYGMTRIPPDCRFEQIAIRGLDLMKGRLTITRAFWENASPDEQALLLVHEAAHSWFTEDRGPWYDTRAIRQLVGLLQTQPIHSKKASELVLRLIETGSPVSETELRSL